MSESSLLFQSALKTGLTAFITLLEGYDPFPVREQPPFQSMLITAVGFNFQPHEIAERTRNSKQSVHNWLKGRPIPIQPFMRKHVRDIILAEMQMKLERLSL